MRFLLLLLDVQIMVMNGFLIPLLPFIYALIEIGSSLMILSGGSVKMGDDSSHQIISIGSVQIKMHDGIIRTLTDVRHIPDMSKNLISLSTLDGKGYKYSGGDVVLKLSKGSLIVMRGDLKSVVGALPEKFGWIPEHA
jgi:5'-3' exoribonuclease 2